MNHRDERYGGEQPDILDNAFAVVDFADGEHVAFRDAIRSGDKPVVSVYDGALAMAMGVAGERSARLGRPVDLSELGF